MKPADSENRNGELKKDHYIIFIRVFRSSLAPAVPCSPTCASAGFLPFFAAFSKSICAQWFKFACSVCVCTYSFNLKKYHYYFESFYPLPASSVISILHTLIFQRRFFIISAVLRLEIPLTVFRGKYCDFVKAANKFLNYLGRLKAPKMYVNEIYLTFFFIKQHTGYSGALNVNILRGRLLQLYMSTGNSAGR